ncbi:hypothetical protein VTN96DRAFT_6080 [Rasamsonia emersonii]
MQDETIPWKDQGVFLTLCRSRARDGLTDPGLLFLETTAYLAKGSSSNDFSRYNGVSQRYTIGVLQVNKNDND